MREAKITSISLPPTIKREADAFQKKRSMTRSELYRAALRRYLNQEKQLSRIQVYGERQARQRGYTSEKDVIEAAVAFRRTQQRKR